MSEIIVDSFEVKEPYSTISPIAYAAEHSEILGRYRRGLGPVLTGLASNGPLKFLETLHHQSLDGSFRLKYIIDHEAGRYGLVACMPHVTVHSVHDAELRDIDPEFSGTLIEVFASMPRNRNMDELASNFREYYDLGGEMTSEYDGPVAVLERTVNPFTKKRTQRLRRNGMAKVEAVVRQGLKGYAPLGQAGFKVRDDFIANNDGVYSRLYVPI